MATSTASSSKSLSARRFSALLASVLVWSCASLASAETPAGTSASLAVSTRVVATCDISNDRIPTASCVGTVNPMIDTASAVVTNQAGEQLAVLVTTMNF